jgi:hypothetical protein
MRAWSYPSFGGNTMSNDHSVNHLIGSWLHAREEDQADVTVYRPEGYPLPPARGRKSITFEADGTVTLGRPGPDDRTVRQPGRWQLDGDRLNMYFAAGDDLSFDVVSMGADLLRVRPVPPRN